MRRLSVIVCGALALLTLSAGPASARWVVGIGIGLPLYAPAPRVYYPYYPYYPYYYPPPVVVQPAYAPPPVVLQQPVAPPAVASTAPVTAPTVAAAPPAPEQVQPPMLRPVATDEKSAEIDRRIEHLSNPNERVRADVAIELGRMRADRAVDALTRTLANDSSATVRESAARALGLIGSSRALSALQKAAQADTDRDVRNSARFAVDVIQTNR